MSQPDTFVIVDGNSLMHRAFHALPPLSNEDGVFTNAVFGFLSMLFKVIGDEQPRYLAVAFDLHGPTFRHTDYSEYKAGRKPTAPELKPQFDLVRECLTKMGVKILTCPTFEADDILGTFARRCEEAGIPALLVTGDRDSMQLVTETSSVLYTRRGVSDVVRYTPEKVLEDFGVTPAQIPDLKGLMGDASDNIPGVPGIGEKTAVKLLTAYGTLENALDHADADLKGRQREKLLDGRMSGLMSKKIATITRYVPLDDVTLEDCRLGDMTGVLPLFEQLGLKTLASRLSQLSGSHAANHAPAAPQIAWRDELTLADEAAVAAFIAALPEAARVALLMREDGVSLAAENGAQAVVPYAQGLLGGGLDPLCAAKALSPLLTGARPLVLFGAKRLKTELAPWNIAVSAPFDDDQLMQYLLAPQNGKYEAPANAAALMQQTLSDERALDEQEMTRLYRDVELPLLATLYDMERDGRIHTWFDQTIAATGRISSSEPNLQNIPVRTPMGREIRRAFIAPAGSVLVDADYSQIELRLLAHLSGDEAMCEAFTLGQDIHARTAAEVYGVPLAEVTPQMRSSAKAVNFGIVYGISDFGLAANLHISRKEAAEFIARYFARYPAIHRFMEACVSQGKAEGYSVTMYGRRRPLPELSSPNYNRRQFGERAAMNTPVQGAAADIIKIAMNAVHDELKAAGLAAKLILQVHDELIVEAPEAEREQVEVLLRRCMENAASLRVPLIADVHSGRSWYDTK